MPHQGASMPIQRLLQERSYDPETVSIIAGAYKCALEALGLKDRDDSMNRLVAQQVLGVVETGLRDEKKICELAVAAVKGRQH
jgi:hypothetical protein